MWRSDKDSSNLHKQSIIFHLFLTGETIVNLLANNVGKTDRIIRVVLGILLVGNVFVAMQSPIGWVGIILVITGAFGICPLYSLTGMNTKSTAEKVGLK